MAEEKNVPKVRTYERDVAEFMKRTGGTAAQIALAEQERKIKSEIRNPKSETNPKSEILKTKTANYAPPTTNLPSIPSPQAEALRQKIKKLALWSILFVVLAGIIGTGYWYLSSLLPKTPTIPAATSKTSSSKIILADSEKTISTAKLTRDTFISAFNREKSGSLPLSSFERIILEKMTAEKFLTMLSAQTDDGFIRALEPDFELGLRGLPTNSAFLIFKTKYYRTALAGMLAWEKTIIDDIGPLFSVPTSGTANFIDKVIKNRDARAFTNEEGRAYLVWGFADKNTIIITDSEDSFLQIIGKLIK